VKKEEKISKKKLYQALWGKQRETMFSTGITPNVSLLLFY